MVIFQLYRVTLTWFQSLLLLKKEIYFNIVIIFDLTNIIVPTKLEAIL